MIDLAEISQDTLIARGMYSTVRAAHEDEKKNLQMLCGALSSTSTRILRHMQPDNDGVPDNASELLAAGRSSLDAIEACIARTVSLAGQRAELKKTAWGGK